MIGPGMNTIRVGAKQGLDMYVACGSTPDASSITRG